MGSPVQTAFFSYCREDSEFALKLAEDLKSAGAHVWIDQLDIEPGAPWDRAVEEALENAPRMLVVLSPVSVNSDNVRDEVSFALSRHKRVIPVLYRDCEVPFRLARLQHIDFRPDYTRGLRILLRALGVAEGVSPQAVASVATIQETEVVVESHPQLDELEREHAAAEQARLEEERRLAAEEARLEREARERLAAEESARQQRLEEQRKAAAAAEQARLEEERRAAAEKAKRDEEHRRAEEAAGAAEEAQRTAGEAQARQEQSRREQRAAEQARLEEEARQAAEKARLAQEEQARREAEIKARQERLRREEQESSERKRLAATLLGRAPEGRADPQPQQAGPKTIELAPGAPRDVRRIPARPREALRTGRSARYIWGGAVLLALIGLTTFLMTRPKREVKPNPPQASQPASGETASPATAQPSSVASTPPSGTASSGNPPGPAAPVASGVESEKAESNAPSNPSASDEAKKPSLHPVPKGAEAALKAAVKSSNSAPDATSGLRRVKLPADISKSFLIRQAVPVYPPLARQARVHGVVALEVVIDKNGVVQNIRTLNGHPLLVPAAIDAVKQWRYKPFVVDNKTVEVDTTVTVNFALTN
jgi:TonB family protein